MAAWGLFVGLVRGWVYQCRGPIHKKRAHMRSHLHYPSASSTSSTASIFAHGLLLRPYALLRAVGGHGEQTLACEEQRMSGLPAKKKLSRGGPRCAAPTRVLSVCKDGRGDGLRALGSVRVCARRCVLWGRRC